MRVQLVGDARRFQPGADLPEEILGFLQTAS